MNDGPWSAPDRAQGGLALVLRPKRAMVRAMAKGGLAMRSPYAVGLILALLLSGGRAAADPDTDRPLRLSGAAPDAQDPMPKTFVIDARIKPGDGDYQNVIEGWFAGVAAPALYGQASGTCVETHCALTVSVVNGKLAIVGDFAGAAASGPARFVLKDDEGKVVGSGTATLGPMSAPAPVLGALAAPDAIDEADLDDLLMWSQQAVSSGSPPTDPYPSEHQHEAVADWQQTQGRLATGLIFAGDLAQLRADRAAAEKKAGWTTFGDAAHGWSGGYPAALLPSASQAGAERRYASADGKAALVTAIDPPMSSEAFDAFVEKFTNDQPGRKDVNTTRVNGDLEARFEEHGVVTVAAYHNREGGLARLVLTYPANRDDAFKPFEAIVQRQFKVGDDLKP
jgi:hypothetical protein